MKSITILKLVVLSGAAAMAAAAGCSSDVKDDETTGGDGGTGPGAGQGGTTAVVTVTTVTSGMGGAGGASTGTAGIMNDMNNSCDEAKEIPVVTDGMVDQPDVGQGQIVPESDYDYYKFPGKKGQVISIYTDAKPSMDPFADGYADTVVTLFDPNKQQVAENDDPIPRTTQDAVLHTVLPADGTYCIRIGDFCQWSKEFKNEPCPTPQVITLPNYLVYVIQLDDAEPDVVNEMEAKIEYNPVPMQTGQYYATVVHGTFDAGDDVDVFEFTPPADLMIMDGRKTADFYVFPTGSKGNGSSAPTGLAWVTEKGQTTRLSQIDATKLDETFGMNLQWAFDPAKTYEVHVQGAGGMPGANPFYFVMHSIGGSNPLEMNEAGNNTTPEPLTQQMTTGGVGYYVAGNITAPGATGDVDQFSVDIQGVPTNYKMSAVCAGKRIGAGLQNLKATLLKGSNKAELGNATETDLENALIGGMMGLGFPMGEKSVILKVEAGAQDANVTGTHYQCAVHFSKPQM
jgi:hypothetical protein